MSQTPDALDLIVLTLIEARLARGDDIFIFTTGNLRGKLVSATYLESALPSQTYLPPNAASDPSAFVEPVVHIRYIPRPRGHDNVKDPLKFKSTRKPVIFNIPTRLVNSALFLQKLADKVWMLNVVTSVKA
jgi:hypothetical protein